MKGPLKTKSPELISYEYMYLKHLINTLDSIKVTSSRKEHRWIKVGFKNKFDEQEEIKILLFYLYVEEIYRI